MGEPDVAIFFDESQGERHFVLGAVVTSGDIADAILAQARKVLRRKGTEVPEFHESVLNKTNPEGIDVLIDNIVFEYRRQRQHRTLRQDVTVWTAYYRKNRAERSRQSLPFDRLLAVYVGLFQTLVAEIAPASGTQIQCDSFQGIERILPELRKIAGPLGATVDKGVSSIAGIQLADVVTGTTRRFLSNQNGDRYDVLKRIVRLNKEFVARAK